MSRPEVLDGVPRRMTDWAVNRSLAPTSVTGISLALGVCAAAWFSAGTRPDNIRGAIALLASYLAWRAARRLAGPAAGGAARPARAGAGPLAELGGTLCDCAVYAGLAVGGYAAHWSGTWELAAAVVIATAVRRTAVECGGHLKGDGEAGGTSGEANPVGSALRGFMAFPTGGRVAVIVIAAPIWGPHATLLILLEWGIIATAYMITGHGPERVALAEGAGRLREPALAAAGPPIRVGSSTRAELSARAELPARTELSARAEYSARVDSPAPAEPSVMDKSPIGAESPPPADSHPRAHSPAGDSPGETDSPVRAPSPAPADSPARLGAAGLSASAALTQLASGTGQSETPLALASSSETTMTLELMIHGEPDRRREPKPRTVLEPRALATIAAYRDDGAAAVWLSRVVRGQFVPLPPAVAGLVATSFLAWLGMRNLGGMLLLTPLVVMLLAAFGSGHPHNGRLDWLVPAVLVAGQLVYIAAIGFSFGVWAPLTFTLCALIALRYVNLARRDRRDPARGAETRLGWEGRMLTVGIGAMLGVPVVAYVALSVYVAAGVCGRIRTGVLALSALGGADRP